MENDNVIALYKRGLIAIPSRLSCISTCHTINQAGYLDDALKTLGDVGLVATEQDHIDMIKLQMLV